MPRYFGQKGHIKQTWQFRKTHPQLRVLQKEAKARMSFFDHIIQALHNQQSPEGTPPSTSKQSQQTPTTLTPPEQISLQPRTKTAKNTFVQKYPKVVMAQPPDHQKDDIYPSTEDILSVTDYEGSKSGTDPERPQPSTDRGTFEAATCQPDKSDCTNI